jgi:single-strand DNA-binding protein
MNVIALTGNLCKAIDLRYTKNEKAVIENTIAVRKEKKNKTTDEYESDFIDFVAFEKKAEYLNSYASKGDKIEITGKLRTDNWRDDEGNYHSKIYIVADTLRILKHKSNELPTNEIIEDSDLPF